MLEATAETSLAVQQLKLPDGIEASLWAAEPLLANPVAFAFDEQGRLFVAETYRYGSSVLDIRGYMGMLEEDMAFRTIEDRAQGIIDIFGEDAPKFEIETEVLRLVEDRDGDGKAETSSVYADGFNSSLDGIASGVLARKGDVYFTNIPSLWKFEGIDENGTAQKSEELLRGFGVHFGYTGHDYHGLAIGPDGKLYSTIGDRGADVKGPDGNHVSYPDTGVVFRSNLDGTELEVVHYGLRNPQELAFDELGNLFTGDNDCDAGDMERLVHVVEGGDSGWRIGHQHAPLGAAGVWMSESWWQTETADTPKFLLPPVSLIEDGPSGIAYYPGTGFSPEYKGHLFITHFKGSRATSGIHSYTMEQKGASFELGESRQFLMGALPTDVTFAPDGNLYFLDWVDSWGKPGIGRVYALSSPEHAGDPIIASTQKLIAGGMTERGDSDLAELLSHPNWNVRLEAQLELADRGEKNANTFTEIATDESAELYPRLHATWGLGILAEKGSKQAATALAQLTNNETAEIRAQATKLAGDHAIEATYEQLIANLTHDNARVRFFASQSLGKLGNPDAAPALIEAARENDDVDAYLRHAIVMGLTGIKNEAALEAAAKDSSAAVRIVTLLTYRRLGDAKVAQFLNDENKSIVLAAARAINDEPITDAYADLAAAIDSPFADDDDLTNRALNAAFRLGGPEQAARLANYAADSTKPEAFRVEALQHLASWPTPLQRDRIMGVFLPIEARPVTEPAKAVAAVADKIFASESGAIQAELIRTFTALDVQGNSDQLFTLVRDESKNGLARVAAFEYLAAANDPRTEELITFAGASSSSELRLATLPIIAKRSPAAAETTLALMVNGSIEEQRVAFATLAESEQAYAARLLDESLQKLVAQKVNPDVQLELLEAADGHKLPAVQEAFTRYQTAIAADPDPVAPYRYALGTGHQWQGSQVYFYNTAMACIRCHEVTGDQITVGPNLSHVSDRLSRQEILESIIAPNAAIAHGFENVILTLADGSSKIGVFESEDDSSITLKAADGTLEVVKKSTISNRTSMPSSMPNIYGPLLSREDLRNLVEYLAKSLTADTTPRVGGHGE